MIKALIFDWGDTVMRDFPDKSGPMATWEHVELIPGVKVALAKLCAEYICCIATSALESDTLLMIEALKRVEADKYFKYFFSSKDLGYRKPDPKFFLELTKNINLNPENCIVIGNSYEKDIIGAKAAKMKTVFFNEYNKKGDFSDADHIINTMKDLLLIINNIK
jgi:FMN phosphatase YigB (HAD superfamily)